MFSIYLPMIYKNRGNKDKINLFLLNLSYRFKFQRLNRYNILNSVHQSVGQGIFHVTQKFNRLFHLVVKNFIICYKRNIFAVFCNKFFQKRRGFQRSSEVEGLSGIKKFYGKYSFQVIDF